MNILSAERVSAREGGDMEQLLGGVAAELEPKLATFGVAVYDLRIRRESHILPFFLAMPGGGYSLERSVAKIFRNVGVSRASYPNAETICEN